MDLFDPDFLAKTMQNAGLQQKMGPSFDQMPAPLMRGGSPTVDDVQPVQPAAPPVSRAPAVVGDAKPADVPDAPPTDDQIVAENQKGFEPANKMQDMYVTKEDLDKAAHQKKIAAALGMMGDALANGQSAGNFYLGRMTPHNDISGGMQKFANMADAPIEQKKVLLAQELKKPEMELAMRSADQGSTESQLMGNMMKANIQNNQQMSPEQKSGMLKLIDGKSAAELNQIAAQPLFKDMMANDKLFQTLNNKIELANTKAEMMRQLAQDRNAGVSKKDQMKNLKETQQAMEQMRGDQSTQQAEKDLYAADKANTLINLYGDPNKLSTGQVKMVVSEVAKIAQGGVPAIHELEGLNPNTWNAKLKEAWGKVVNSPQPANLAAFVKQYQDYANGVTSDAENHILDRYSRIIDPRRDYLSPQDQQRLDEKYTHRFDENRKKRSASSGGGGMDAKDQAAFQHAKDNPTDPDSKAIFQVLKKKYPNLVN